jgi:AcrR family transcriptional regulator
MFNSSTAKGARGRAAILAKALELFRREGLEQTKMRDIAREGQVALGAAYYYFPSKEAIVQAYYEDVQRQHEERVREALAAEKLQFRDRLGAVFHSKIDILKDDQKLLGAIFRYTGDPDHPLSTLGPATRQSREHSIAIFARALADESLPTDLANFLPVVLWALHMGILLFFIYDRSPQQKRTRKLIDGSLDLVTGLLKLARSPLMKPFRGKLVRLLRDVELLPLEDTALAAQPMEELQ